MFSNSEILPHLTEDFQGIGGKIKSRADDFIVEEIPAYEPSGTGEHLFLWIEKRDLPHDLLLRRLSKTLDVSANDIGVAGIKDRRAITRQYVSVPIRCAARVEQLESEELHVLRAVPHANKLRTGHVRGNRFEVIVRDTTDDAESRVTAIQGRIHEMGFPNYYGEQRFGFDGQTLTLGLDLLTGRKSPRDIPYQKRKFLLRLALSSVQSSLFNQALASRLRDGLLHTVLDGDVMEVVESGGKFLVEDAVTEHARLNAGELTITGPMFGVKMMPTSGVPSNREARTLEDSGLKITQFANFAQLLSGTRRAMTVRPLGLSSMAVESGMRFEFTLPTGSYATMLLREFMKSDDQLATVEAPQIGVDSHDGEL